jgi:3-hydroxyisobutyrate dehydrogenase-like beta-hydroxyacid dehydrogenase
MLSKLTQDRAAKAPITLLASDADLVKEADYVISIVPPKDAIATADRIQASFGSRATPLYYLDLNAVAPSTATSIASRFESLGDKIVFVDGGIIGGPPRPRDANSESTDPKAWYRPSIVLSGPQKLAEAPTSGAHLAELLNTKHVSPNIGTASGLKCCFASLSKGFTALAIQSFSTAAKLGVLDELRAEIKNSNPETETRAVRGLVSMPPKAGRWVKEMQEIGKTFSEAGGWESNVFEEIAGIYKYVSEDSVLGQEHGENRVRGKTVEDVVAALIEGQSGQK